MSLSPANNKDIKTKFEVRYRDNLMGHKVFGSADTLADAEKMVPWCRRTVRTNIYIVKVITQIVAVDEVSNAKV